VFAFPSSTEITFINLDFSGQGTGFGQFLGKHLASAMVNRNGGIPGHTNQIGSGPSRSARDKMFTQAVTLSRAQSTFSLIHGASLAQSLMLS